MLYIGLIKCEISLYTKNDALVYIKMLRNWLDAVNNYPILLKYAENNSTCKSHSKVGKRCCNIATYSIYFPYG